MKNRRERISPLIMFNGVHEGLMLELVGFLKDSNY